MMLPLMPLALLPLLPPLLLVESTADRHAFACLPLCAGTRPACWLMPWSWMECATVPISVSS